MSFRGRGGGGGRGGGFNRGGGGDRGGFNRGGRGGFGRGGGRGGFNRGGYDQGPPERVVCKLLKEIIFLLFTLTAPEFYLACS